MTYPELIAAISKAERQHGIRDLDKLASYSTDHAHLQELINLGWVEEAVDIKDRRASRLWCNQCLKGFSTLWTTALRTSRRSRRWRSRNSTRRIEGPLGNTRSRHRTAMKHYLCPYLPVISLPCG